MNSSDVIRIANLCKVFRVGKVEVPALRGVDLNIRRGEFVSIVGPSGSGKSTLFHIVGGLTPPTSGTVIVEDRDLTGMTDAERTNLRKSRVAFVFQKFNLLPNLTAQDNIDVARHLAGNRNGDDKKFLEVLEMLGIANRLHHKPGELSGGEQQRVAIARAIVNHPAILLADEPTGNLDTANSQIVLDVLRNLNRTIGQTILMITHNPDAAAIGDRTVHMRDGRIVD